MCGPMDSHGRGPTMVEGQGLLIGWPSDLFLSFHDYVEHIKYANVKRGEKDA